MVNSQVQVRVESTPPGAMITMTDGAGRKALGRAPVEHEVEYVQTVYESGPGAWVTTGISAVVTAIGVGMTASASGSTTFDSGGSLRDTSDSGLLVGGITMMSLGATVFAIALPVAIIGSSVGADGDVLGAAPKNGAVSYEADLDGYRGASAYLTSSPHQPWLVQLALVEDHATLARGPGGLGGLMAGAPAETFAGGSSRSGSAPFVAVFDVEDRTGKLDAATLAALTDQLATQLAERRAFRVVPASDLRARLLEAKKASYGACIDERCQIELGKAVAADRTLSARVIQVGETCTINGTVYDLKTEATERAASVRGRCALEALVESIDALAQKLSAP